MDGLLKGNLLMPMPALSGGVYPELNDLIESLRVTEDGVLKYPNLSFSKREEVKFPYPIIDVFLCDSNQECKCVASYYVIHKGMTESLSDEDLNNLFSKRKEV